MKFYTFYAQNSQEIYSRLPPRLKKLFEPNSAELILKKPLTVIIFTKKYVLSSTVQKALESLDGKQGVNIVAFAQQFTIEAEEELVKNSVFFFQERSFGFTDSQAVDL